LLRIRTPAATAAIVGRSTGTAAESMPQMRAAWRAHSIRSNASGCGGTKTWKRSSYERRQMEHSGMAATYTGEVGQWPLRPVFSA
jgi:hypothetical protein